MGASWSGIFGTVDNKSTRQILDTILKRLITETDMRDMYGLADPAVCKKFIIFGTKAFNKLFVKVKLNKKTDGTLFFQQLRGLAEQNPEAKEQQENCKKLAFFYVRIFQIYAAIALSIFDSNLPDVELSQRSVQQAPYKTGAQFFNPQTGFKGFSKDGSQGLFGQSQGFMQKGGELESSTTNSTSWKAAFFLDPNDTNVQQYSLLNKYLVVSKDNLGQPSLSVEPKFTGSNGSIFINYNELYEEYVEPTATGTGTATATATATVQGRRTPKNLVADGLPLVCSIRVQGITVEIKATLKIHQNKTEFEVDTISGADTTFTTFKRAASIINGYFMTGDTKHFTEYILQQLIEQYNDKNKITFNALDFLSTHDVLAVDNQIRDSYFSVLKRQGERPELLVVEYAPDEPMKITADSSKVKIKIQMILEIVPKKQTTALKRYDVKLHFKNVKTSPSELEDIFNIYETYSDHGGFKHATFTTGEKDTGVPIQEGYRGSIGAFLQRTIESILNNRDKVTDLAPYSVRGDLQYRRGMPEPYNSDSMDAEFRIKSIWKALAKDPPIKAHCMARALQLLNLSAIKGDSNGAYSRVCFTSEKEFSLLQDGSLPVPGKKVTDAPGINALAMLFVNVIDKSADAIKGSEEYKEFRTKFKRTFEKYEENYVKEGNTPPPTLDGIVDKAMPFCQDHQNQRINLDANTTYQLRLKVNELQNRQAAHVRGAMYILFKLFNEKEIRAGRFELSDYVWQEGTDALAQLTVETRDLLMAYYTDCEKTYKDGLYILYDKFKVDK